MARAVDIELRAKLNEFKKELEGIPGLTKKEARKMTAEFRRAWRQQEDDQRKVLREQTKAVEQASNAWKNRLRGALDEIHPALGQVADASDEVSLAMGAGGMTAVIGGAVVAVTAAAAATGLLAAGLYDLAGDAYDARVEILKASRETKIAAETMAALQLATQGTDVEFKDAADSVRDFAEKMFDFANGGGAAEEAFRDLGIAVDRGDGTLRDVNDVFVETIEKLQQMEDGGKQVAYAQQLMSDDGQKLMTVLGDRRLSEHVALVRELGLNVGPAAAEAAARWEAAQSQLTVATSKLGDALLTAAGHGDGFAGAVEAISMEVIALAKTVEIVGPPVVAAFREMANAGDDIVVAMAKLAAGDVGGAALALAEGGWEASGAFEELASIDTSKIADEIRKAKEALDSYGASREAAFSGGSAPGSTRSSGPAAGSESSSPAADTLGKMLGDLSAVADAYDAYVELQSTIESLQMAQLEGEEAINARYDKRLQRIRELGLVSGEYEEARLAATLLQGEREQELDAYREHVAQVEQDRRQKAVEGAAAVGQAAVDFGGAISDLILQVSGANVTSQERMTEKQKKAMLAAFRIQQATALAQAAINTALSITQALGNLPPPASFVVAGLTGAMAAVQVGLIAAQKPPSFHVGGLIGGGGTAPDEVSITARRGEGVVSAEGMAQLGREGLDELNRGRGVGSGPIVVVAQVGSETIEATTAMALERPSPSTRRALRRAGGRPGHRNRRR